MADMRDNVPLSALKAGEKATITALADSGSDSLKKLLSLGIYPGLTLCLLQRYPSYIFRIGFTQVAVDKKVARAIRVRKEAG